MKKQITIFLSLIFVLGLVPFNFSNAASLTTRLKGRILLQVESAGEAWYINPENEKRYYLGRPADAFQVMRELGLGISNKDFDSFNGKAPSRLSGKILLKVEASGEAYYVNPVDLKMHYLGRPADAFQIMRNLGLGASNIDLEKISVAKNSKSQNQIINEKPEVLGIQERAKIQPNPEPTIPQYLPQPVAQQEDPQIKIEKCKIYAESKKNDLSLRKEIIDKVWPRWETEIKEVQKQQFSDCEITPPDLTHFSPAHQKTIRDICNKGYDPIIKNLYDSYNNAIKWAFNEVYNTFYAECLDK